MHVLLLVMVRPVSHPNLHNNLNPAAACTSLLLLQHTHHSFKYDQALVKEMLQKKRAAGKMVGGYAQTRARLTHELILAQQEGRSDDDIQR